MGGFLLLYINSAGKCSIDALLGIAAPYPPSSRRCTVISRTSGAGHVIGDFIDS
jgi:hypothetical protein